jgi:hypothetical protein
VSLALSLLERVLDVRLGAGLTASAGADVPAVRKQGRELRKALGRDEHLLSEQRPGVGELKRILG